MTIFDRYLLKRLFISYFGILFALIPFYCVIDLGEHIDDFKQNGATWAQVLGVYYPSLSGEIVRLMSPLAIILTCLFITLRLVKSQQFTALYTAGVSFWRIARIYAFFGGFITLFMLWFGGWIVPESNRINNAFADKYLNASSFDPDASREVVKRYSQLSTTEFLEIDTFEEQQKIAIQPFWIKIDTKGKVVYRMDALQMKFDMKTKQWIATNGKERFFNKNGTQSVKPFTQKSLKISLLPDDFKFSAQKISELSPQASQAFIRRQQNAGTGNVARPMVDLWGRFGWACSNLVVVFLALSLAARRKKYENAVVIGIGLMVAFIYLLGIKLTEPFAYKEVVLVWVAVVIPHLLFLGLGLWGLTKIEQ